MNIAKATQLFWHTTLAFWGWRATYQVTSLTEAALVYRHDLVPFELRLEV